MGKPTGKSGTTLVILSQEDIKKTEDYRNFR